MGYVVLAAIIVELASISIVSDLVGWLWTMAALAGGVVLGMSVLAGRGVATMQKAAGAMQGGEPVGAVIVEGALVAVAGVLFLIPGFVSDVVGLALLVPPVRVLVRKVAGRRFTSRFVVVGAPPTDPGFIDVEGHEVRDERERDSRRPELP